MADGEALAAGEPDGMAAAEADGRTPGLVLAFGLVFGLAEDGAGVVAVGDAVAAAAAIALAASLPCIAPTTFPLARMEAEWGENAKDFVRSVPADTPWCLPPFHSTTADRSYTTPLKAM